MPVVEEVTLATVSKSLSEVLVAPRQDFVLPHPPGQRRLSWTTGVAALSVATTEA
ncbi:hypothetical protein [Nocardioides flavescens]|uniref:Uncharacterized protein n=1 Tax=Nocardioides flavescens TaxID=2691959 RepID=A0A6L7EX00_9ACTN|nr:hypothetical protein [Nocardioides flavescens]MXG88569.1 hypothetical protein [Nocardioides flavescens]